MLPGARTGNARRLQAMVAALVCACLLAACLRAPGGDVAGTGGAFRPVDHSLLEALLQRHVRDGLVDYTGLAREKRKLDAYLALLARADLRGAPRASRLAFWINAYNACTLRLILRHLGRIKSIREIEKKFGYHQWKTREWTLAGRKLSLDDIEHRKLRRELGESRIHFAIVCASRGCPALWRHAYSAKAIDAQLDAAANRFLAKADNLQTGFKRGWLGGKQPLLRVSRIFSWFAGDFKPGVVEFIARYAPRPTREFIQTHRRRLTLSYLDYDWSLNAAPPATGGKGKVTGRDGKAAPAEGKE